MSSARACLYILFVLLPVLASGRGGGRGGGGRGGGGHSYGGGHSTGHSYPSGGGLSGHGQPNHNYPHSNTGLSGNSRPQNTHTTVHHHYYSPPTQVHYGTGYHPVYHGTPPVYVYTYRDSGSRYNDLLTGLALYNLGRMSAHHDHNYYSHAQSYSGPAGEVCELQIIKTNGEYERTKIQCQLMSSFIVDAERNRDKDTNRVVSSNTHSVTTVEKVDNSGVNSSEVVTKTVQNTTVVEALETKGPPIEVTSGMSCFMVRRYRGDEIREKVDCGLLHAYAKSSFRNTSSRNVPVINIVILLSSLLYIVM